MTCAHISEQDRVCGRPAVAVWWHPVLGEWPLCARDDANAVRAGVAGWTREECPQSAVEGQGAPQTVGAA
jgi:hypothetical protein